jgi:hypothetical protein
MDFRKLTLEDKKLFEKYLAKDDLGWEYNFATLYLWDVNDTMMCCECDGMLLIYNIFNSGVVFMPPYLKNKSDFLGAVDAVAEYARSMGIKYCIRGLTASQAARLDSGRYFMRSNRDDSDYIYSSDALKRLEGKAFHSKRNFVTRFTKTYDYELKDYEQADYDGIMRLYDAWEVDTAHSTLALERTAITRALKFSSDLDLKIAVLKVQGKYVGFSVSSLESNGVVHTVFEKADTTYTGIYQALNKLAAEKYFPDGALVNRQEDMGIEGLRKAKLSYNPVKLLDKYFVGECAGD